MSKETRQALELSYKMCRFAQEIAGHLALVDAEQDVMQIIDKVDTVWHTMTQVTQQLEQLTEINLQSSPEIYNFNTKGN